MIGIVLKKHSDYGSFEALLQQHDYTYTIKFKRIFFVESTLEEFQLRDFPLIESCENSGEMNIAPASVDRFDSDIQLEHTTTGAIVTDQKSWGPHRVIRRANPFSQPAPSYERTFDLAYKCNRTGAGTDVYIMDMGISSYHQEVAGRITYIGGTGLGGLAIGATDFESSFSYGTHGLATTTCAAGTHTGIASDAEIFFVHYDGIGGSTDQDYLDHIEIAYNHYMTRTATNRPAVVNVSWGGRYESISAVITAAYGDMLDDGLIIVVAANNDRWDLDVETIIPAEAHADFVVVGGTDAHDGPLWLSRGTSGGTKGTGVGSGVDIYAPATHLPLAVKSEGINGYVVDSGTSFAAPYTAGVLACMMQGYQRPTTRAQGNAVVQKMIDNSTKGALKFGTGYYGNSIVHDRLLYLDPIVDIEPIAGLTLL